MNAATEWLTPEDAATALNLQPKTILQHCRTGEFEGARKFGGRWRIPAAALDPSTARPLLEPPSKRSLAQQRRRRAA